MRVAIVGCGYVANFYLKTLPLYPEIELLGVMDIDGSVATKFAQYFAIPHQYQTLDEVLNDVRVELVVNLTNPRTHYAVSKACLEAGKHVYSEKPLAMSFADAKALVELAEQKGLLISSAPSRVLAETAQTMWKALRENAIGTPYLTYAEMDDGLVHQMPYQKWINELGTPWPYKDEFETGCTLEHGGYVLTLLTAFFGPVESVAAMASARIPEKIPGVPIEPNAPDFSVACLKFASGHMARVTCSIVAPPDHSIRIFGSHGTLYTHDIWEPRANVYVKRSVKIRQRSVNLPWGRKVPMVGPEASLARAQVRRLKNKKVDFCLGIVEMIQAIHDKRPCRLSPRYCLHHDEIVFAMHHASETGSVHRMTTTIEPMVPMDWAKS